MPARKGSAVRKPAPKKPSKTATKAPTKPARGAAPTAPAVKGKVAPSAGIPLVRRADGRAHVLSLSFVRDGDEFLARMETDGGQITELKNRALDQLLTLVASELEDLLE
ncbi:MAG: hypothetical protein ACREEC_02330 [Thermoplasmata archaeon]